MSEFTPQAPTEVISKEHVTDVELGNLLAAFGNSEAKTIVLGLMKPDVVYTSGDLFRTTTFAQGQDLKWRGNTTPFSYCENSFEPIGLVARDIKSESGLVTIGYMKTKKGENEGDSLAGHILDWSRRYPNAALMDILGNTASASQLNEENGTNWKKRAPLTRIKILFELATADLPIREVDLMQAINEDQSLVHSHLVALNRKAIIVYDAPDLGKPQSVFTLQEERSETDPAPYSIGDRYYATRTREIYQILTRDPQRQWTIDEIVNALSEEYPQLPNQVNLTKSVTGILAHFVREGYLKKDKYSDEKKSDINLTDEQRAMILDFLEIIDNFQNQDSDFLKRGKELLSRILSDPQKVSDLMQKAREHSPSANKKSESIVGNDLQTLISSNLGITSKELQQLLAYPLGIQSVNRVLLKLMQAGKLKAETVRGVPHYYPQLSEA